MIMSILIIIAALLLQSWDWIFKPRSVTCPQGWYVNGVRPSGATQCLPSPPPNCGEPRPPHDQPCPEAAVEIPRRVYCEDNEQPLVVDERSVRCAKGSRT